MVPDSERLAFVQRILHSAQKTAATTHIDEAKTYFNYVLERGVIWAVAGAGQQGLDLRFLQSAKGTNQPPAHKPNLFIVPFFRYDEFIAPSCQDLIKKEGVSALFRGSANTIFLWSEQCQETDFVQGATFIHECGHGFRAFLEKRLFREPTQKGPRPDWLLREETELNFLTARLWKEKGGVLYGDLLKTAVDYLTPHMSPPSYYITPPIPEYLGVLEQVFGVVAASEQYNRWGHFWLYAHFEFLQRAYKRNFKEISIDLMRTYYAHHGM